MRSISTRSQLAKYNIILNFINKGVSIIISFLFVSATINYLDPDNYGVWITLSSIVTWAGYFDFGLQHGFRNHLTKAISNNNENLEKELVSTTYIVIGLIYMGFLIIFTLINYNFNWSKFLHLNIQNSLLQYTFEILIFFFSLQAVLNLIQTVLSADQRPAYGSMIYTIGQLFALIGIYIISSYGEEGEGLIRLSWIIGGIPALTFTVFSIILYNTKYRTISPSVKNYKRVLIKKIIGLGSKFFFIQLSLILIFQSSNIIITKTIGPENATIFNVAYKYYGIVYMLSVIILTPFWSAFTDAYEKKDMEWMNRAYNKLNKMSILCIPILIILLLSSKFVYKLWIKDTVLIPMEINISMALYMLFMVRGALYMYLINGIGKVKLQMLVYILFGIVSIPIMYFSALKYGLVSIIIFGAVVYFIQAMIGQIQLRKILNNKASGIWNQ